MFSAIKGTAKLTSSALVLLFYASLANAQTFPLASGDLADSAALTRTMPRLAAAVLATYADSDRATFLGNRFRLQLVAGRYDDALRSLADLRALLSSRPSPTALARAINVQYEIYGKAMATQAAGKEPFAAAFEQEFRGTMRTLDDRTAALVIRASGLPLGNFERLLREAVRPLRERASLSRADALALVRAYLPVEAYRAFTSIAVPLSVEDDQRRYAITWDIPVRTPDSAIVCAAVVRPRHGPPRLPALLEFTIYADSGSAFRESRHTAAHGYVAVSGFTRGKRCSPGTAVPYRYDGLDAAALIDWISRQPWSDGRVGMYSGSYESFTQWAAVKHMPPALKAIMTGAAAAPGIDVPMEGNVFWNYLYPWPFYATNNKTVDDATYNQYERWQRLNHDWYVSGRAYRDLDRIDGTPNPVWDEWLAHPSYDAWWQSMIPYRQEFARVNIPVLQTAGYYYGGPGAAVYYVTEHYKYDPGAEDYLLIGPYDHFEGHRGVIDALGDTATALNGLTIDPVARISIAEDLRYAWFDYVFKGGPKPALLADRVNYEVTGANTWRHAPSIAAMANDGLRFYLSAERSGDAHRLTSEPSPADSSVTLTVNLADRSDADRQAPGGGVLDTVVDTWNGLEFVSDPLSEPTELTGLFSGSLDFITNKRDFDFNIALYELTSRGEYIQLTSYWARASYVGDLTTRRLLTPGERVRLPFASVRLMGRLCQPGSRIVAVLNIIKNPGQQINYGTGKDVSDETIADAGEPLTIRWFADSYLVLPRRR